MSLQKAASFLKGGMKDTHLLSFIESPHSHDDDSAFQYLLHLWVRKPYVLHVGVSVCVGYPIGGAELCAAECTGIQVL